MKELVEVIAKALVDSPDEVVVTEKGSGKNITVELHIVVIYGMNINAIATSITEKVKYVVNQTTGINVEKVIVKVDGIKEE